MYPVKIIASKESLYSPINDAIKKLNEVQNEFLFRPVEARLQSEGFLLTKSRYQTDELFEWMVNFRQQHNGYRPFMILVVDVPIDGAKLGNLFGNFARNELLAVVTTESFNQFVHDIRRFCMYYFTRYALSFLHPGIRSHDNTAGCMFDKKLSKMDLLLSMNTGNICDACRQQLQSALSPEIHLALTKMLKLVSNSLPHALIMKGGGVKGLAYAGALLVLEKYFSFDVFAGTSAGAFAAVLLGAGYTPEEIKKIFVNLNFNDFRDALWEERGFNLLFRGGAHPGKSLENIIELLLFKKTGRSRIPMKALTNRSIIYATQKGIGTIIFDSHGERQDECASFAARCSMSIPGFFIPPKIANRAVFDGGIKNNFPTYVFKKQNPQKPFIGLYLFTPPSDEKKLFEGLWNLVDIITDAEDREIYEEHQDRLVVINTGPLKMTDFNLTQTKKEFLLLSGKLAAVEFIKKYYPDCDTSMYDVNKLKKSVQDKLQLL